MANGQFTEAQIDSITQAIAQGATTVEYDGKRVSYASIAEMLKLRDRMIREVQRQDEGIAPPVARPSVFCRR